MKNNFNTPILSTLLVLATLLLTACGGSDSGGSDSGDSDNGGSGEETVQYQVSTNVSTVQLEAIVEGNDVTTKSLEVTASFNGDGVIVGYAPGVEVPIWLDITVVSSSTNSAVFEFTPVYYNQQPGEYTTTVRFVTGKSDGSVVEYTSVNITYTVEEYFGISLTDSVFLSIGKNTEEADLKANIVISDNVTGLVASDYDWEFISSSESWLGLSKNTGVTSSQELGPELSINKSLLLANLPGERYEAEMVIATKHEKYGRKEHTVKANTFIQMPYVAIDDSVPNELDFFINKADISLSNSLLLSLNEADRRVYFTDINNFSTIGYYPLNGEPRGMSVSPNGQLLYVSTYDNGTFVSQLVVIDLSVGSIINKFDISGGNQYGDINLVGNDAGEVFIGGHGSIDRFNAYTGELTATIGQSSGDKAYSLSSDQASAYAILLDSLDNELIHINPSQEGDNSLEITFSQGPSYLGTKLWLDTAANILLTKYGHVFDADSLMYQSRIITDEQGIKDVAFDTLNNKALIAEWSWSRGSEDDLEIVYSYDLPNFTNEQIVTSDGNDIRYLFTVDGKLLVIEWYGTHYQLRYL